MQVSHDCLDAFGLKIVSDDLNTRMKAKLWASSAHLWNADIRVGVIGHCMVCEVGPEVEFYLASHLKPLLPNSSKLLIQHYLWHPLSGISAHSDASYKFGATIYLSENWQINDGGIFLWRERDSQQLKCIEPTYNTMVVNNEREQHWVTCVSPLAKKPRVTLQIWGI